MIFHFNCIYLRTNPLILLLIVVAQAKIIQLRKKNISQSSRVVGKSGIKRQQSSTFRQPFIALNSVASVEGHVNQNISIHNTEWINKQIYPFTRSFAVLPIRCDTRIWHENCRFECELENIVKWAHKCTEDSVKLNLLFERDFLQLRCIQLR